MLSQLRVGRLLVAHAPSRSLHTARRGAIAAQHVTSRQALSLLRPAPRRLLCSEPPPRDKVPKGFKGFFQHKPKGAASAESAAEGSAKGAASEGAAAEGGSAAEGS